jgi:hypothetical protein
LLNRGRRGRLVGGEHVERFFRGRFACGLDVEDVLTARAADVLAAQLNGEGVNDAAVGATHVSEHPSNPLRKMKSPAGLTPSLYENRLN